MTYRMLSLATGIIFNVPNKLDEENVAVWGQLSQCNERIYRDNNSIRLSKSYSRLKNPLIIED